LKREYAKKCSAIVGELRMENKLRERERERKSEVEEEI
jgi:hypothetical protein